MSDKPCPCDNVKPNDDGTWQCMICREKFIRLKDCWECKSAQAEEQEPVSFLEEVKQEKE